MPGMFILIVVIIIVVVSLNLMMAAKRRRELMAWAASNNLSYKPGKDRSMDDRYPSFQILRKGSNRYAYNIMKGHYSQRPFLAFDYHYETRSTNSKGRSQTHSHNFSTVIIETEVPLKNLFIRPEGFFDKITQFVGYDDIDFESAEFSRKFYVKADDRRWAFDVIHARTMEFLLSMPQFYIEFDRDRVIAYRSSRFSSEDFDNSARVVSGILDRLPDYLVKQQKERGY